MNYKEIALAGHMAIQFTIMMLAAALINREVISIGEGLIVFAICTGSMALIGKQ